MEGNRLIDWGTVGNTSHMGGSCGIHEVAMELGGPGVGEWGLATIFIFCLFCNAGD